MIDLEGWPSEVLEAWSNERVRAFQMLVDLQSTQHKLRVQNDTKFAYEDCFFRQLNSTSTEVLKREIDFQHLNNRKWV